MFVYSSRGLYMIAAKRQLFKRRQILYSVYEESRILKKKKSLVFINNDMIIRPSLSLSRCNRQLNSIYVQRERKLFPELQFCAICLQCYVNVVCNLCQFFLTMKVYDNNEKFFCYRLYMCQYVSVFFLFFFLFRNRSFLDIFCSYRSLL